MTQWLALDSWKVLFDSEGHAALTLSLGQSESANSMYICVLYIIQQQYSLLRLHCW